MDKIQNLLNDILEKYPETWSDIDEYIKYMMPYEHEGFFDYKSKYYKEFVPKVTGPKVVFFSIDKADDEAKKYRGSFSLYLIDFEELFKDFDKFYFDIESWSDRRRETILKRVDEFLFECNTFKGISFFKELGRTILEINGRLTNLKKTSIIYSDKPNWLQKKIRKVLKLEIETIQNILISNYELVYPKLNSVFINTDGSISPSSTSIWFKIAQIMATGYLKIEKHHYIVDGQKIYNESEVARIISKHLYGNESKSSSISPYLNQTKQGVKGDNKNIFIPTRIKELKFIAFKASQQNNLSEYFKEQISKLESINTN
jgi:hypothetical protein